MEEHRGEFIQSGEQDPAASQDALSRAQRRAEWKDKWTLHYSNECRAASAVNFFVLPEPLNMIRFMMLPFCPSSPVLATISGVMLKPHSCRAAQRAISVAMSEPIAQRQLQALMQKREVFLRYTTDRARPGEIRNVKDGKTTIIVKQGKFGRGKEYMMLPGFDPVDVTVGLFSDLTDESFTAEEASAEGEQSIDAVTSLLASVINSAGYEVNRMTNAVTGLRQEELADEMHVSKLDLVIAQRVFGLLMMLLPWRGDSPHYENMNAEAVFNLAVTLGTQSSLSRKLCTTFLEACSYAVPICSAEIQAQTGCYTCMPNEQGWGWLAPNDFKERTLLFRKQGAVSMHNLFELAMRALKEDGASPFDTILQRLCTPESRPSLEDWLAFTTALDDKFQALFSISLDDIFMHNNSVLNDQIKEEQLRIYNSCMAPIREHNREQKERAETRLAWRQRSTLLRMERANATDGTRYRLASTRMSQNARAQQDERLAAALAEDRERRRH